MQVLASILGSEPSGRLYKALVETKKAASVSARPQALPRPGHARDHGRGQHQGPGGAREGPRHDVLGARRGRSDRASPRRRSIAPGSRSSRIASWPPPTPTGSPISSANWAAQGDWRLYFLNRDRIEKVTPAQVKEVAARYLTPSNRTVGFFIPSDEARADARPRRRPTSPSSSRATRAARPVGGRVVRRLARWPSRPGCSGPSRSRGSRSPSCPRRPGARPSTCT